MSEATVYSVTFKILSQMEGLQDTGAGKALLANLRNSIGKDLSSSSDVWPILFENLPEEFLGDKGFPTCEEQAILNTLQLYALHQQGNTKSVVEKDNSWKNIGESLRVLRDKDSAAIDRRFNTMITSATYSELLHHLRQLIKLLKSKSDETVNYSRLANDLYWYQRGYVEQTRLKWAREYYKIKNTNKGDQEND